MDYTQSIKRPVPLGPLPRHSAEQFPPENVVFGMTPKMQLIRQKIEKIHRTDLPVLIHGESGTGKEIIAAKIHANSPCASGKFVKVNCPAIPATLIESELFGYEKGSFTGANAYKPGRVELANRGTLFLDEIGELDAALQAKLLQLLQDGRYCPIGGQQEKKVEVRFICATNRELEDEIAAGNFRQDLFYRINVVNIELPPLRERCEDIPEIAGYFLEVYNDKFNCRARPVSPRLMNAMQQYHWPGNIRQLENLMKRYVVLGSEEAVFSELEEREPDLFNFTIPADGQISLKHVTKQAVRQVERKIILKVVQANNWNRKRAAKLLNISYRALLYKLKDAGVPPQRERVARMKEAEPPIMEEEFLDV
jgi:two-component system, NtrC family, response regulator AtoC